MRDTAHRQQTQYFQEQPHFQPRRTILHNHRQPPTTCASIANQYPDIPIKRHSECQSSSFRKVPCVHDNHKSNLPVSVSMDQRELDSRIKALQKSINDKEPASNVIAIMETLKNNVNPTEELLRVRSRIVAYIPEDCLQRVKPCDIADLTLGYQGWHGCRKATG